MPTTQSSEGLSAALGLIHARWIATVEEYLTPAMAPGADFWTRWACARFLNERLESFYRLEASLFEQLAPSLPDEDSARLRQRLGELERTRARLVGLGRRRGTGTEMGRQAKKLLVQIRGWSRDLEDTMRPLDLSDLSPGCKDLLKTLEGDVDLAS